MLNKPITEAWTRLRYFLKCLGGIFGEPAEVAAHWLISAERRADLLSWLRPLERTARMILLAEAEATPVPALSPPRNRAQAKAKSARKPRDVSHENSEAWRVSFRVLTPDRAKRGAMKPRLDPGVHPYDPKPLAARFEALIRIALDPAPRVRRLALRMRRRALSWLQHRRLLRCPRIPTKNPIERVIPEIRDLLWPALAAPRAADTG